MRCMGMINNRCPIYTEVSPVYACVGPTDSKKVPNNSHGFRVHFFHRFHTRCLQLWRKVRVLQIGDRPQVCSKLLCFTFELIWSSSSWSVYSFMSVPSGRSAGHRLALCLTLTQRVFTMAFDPSLPCLGRARPDSTGLKSRAHLVVCQNWRHPQTSARVASKSQPKKKSDKHAIALSLWRVVIVGVIDADGYIGSDDVSVRSFQNRNVDGADALA